jgi:hypothetical protein
MELEAAQRMAISVRIGGASGAPQLTSAPFATTSIPHDDIIHRGRHGDSRFLRATGVRVATSVRGKTRGTGDKPRLLFLDRNEGMPYPRSGPRR